MSNQPFNVIIASPGRINLIGEHIDYNGGFVLPAAIDKKITLKFKENGTNSCFIFSKNFDLSFQNPLNNVTPSKEQWQNYLLGVIYHIQKLKPNSIKGFDCSIESDLPLGSGLSSSAALECGLAKGLNELFEIGLTDIEMIKLSRDAEHTFVGTKCGIMDQFAVMKGQKNQLLLLNCETLVAELVPANFKDYELILLNTNVSHNLANSEYNLRREECRLALEIIQKEYSEFSLLAQVPLSTLEEFITKLPAVIYKRARYVISENQRTLAAVQALKEEDILEVGALMYKAHEDLSKNYEVSCQELDFLVDYTKDLPFVVGSRMMGGGFGGCTINLVHKDFIEMFIEKMSKVYNETFNIALTPIAVGISNGTSVVTHK